MKTLGTEVPENDRGAPRSTGRTNGVRFRWARIARWRPPPNRPSTRGETAALLSGHWLREYDNRGSWRAAAARSQEHPITPIRPPRGKSAENSPAALRSSATSERWSGPRVSDFISIIGCRAVCRSAPNTYRGSSRHRDAGAGEAVFSRALETHLCPRTVRFREMRARSGACAMASYLRARVRGRAYIQGSEYGVFLEREEASNHWERLPRTNGLELSAGLAPSPPWAQFIKRSMSKAVERRSM